MTVHAPPPPAPPIGLLVELTHRCPLGCLYCSNPIALERPGNELDGETWKRVFSEAAALGALHVHLSGGEPTARRDIVDLTGHASKAGLYTNLITSGIGVSEKLTGELADSGLDHAQLSFQGADQETNDRLGHYKGSWERKRAFAGYVIKEGLPLTINAVIHRSNFIRWAPSSILRSNSARAGSKSRIPNITAGRSPIAPRLCPLGRMSTNRSPSSRRRASASRANSSSTWWSPTITRAIPSPARGAGGGSRSMCRRPARRCPATRPNRFRASNSGMCAIIRLSEIWRSNPAFNAFRGTDWMPEPCRSCERREIDWGGCRCQALALTGDARNTDPACHKSPHHERIAATAMAESESGDGGPLRWRSYKKDKVEA